MATLFQKDGECHVVDPANWNSPDSGPLCPINMGFTQDKWGKVCCSPKLFGYVPTQIREEFERARGAILYGGWYFYGLASLGLDHCWRIHELAARTKCIELGHEPKDFDKAIKWLLQQGIFSGKDAQMWQAARSLRNKRSHLESRFLWDAPGCVSSLRGTAEKINKLFGPPVTRRLNRTKG